MMTLVQVLKLHKSSDIASTWARSIIILLVVLCPVSGEEYSTITTPSGPVKGVLKNVAALNSSVFQYLGIPYAQPPIGDLRFRKPEIIKPWSNILNATKYGFDCPQAPSDPNLVISENCLFLNIYEPKTTETNMSVMIFIHGGGYVLGTGSLYDGSSLALVGNVIVVTINYRLGFLGFMSTMDSSSPGNYGLWDQRMAIRWVKENIASFGGNPSSITIFGESAGGSSVSLQALYPGNRGLFQNVIAQSGVAISAFAVTANAKPTAIKIGEMLGCQSIYSDELVTCLRGKSVDNIIAVSDNYTMDQYINEFNILPHFAPVVDNDFLKDEPMHLLQNQNSDSNVFFRSLNLIAGTVDAEGSLILSFMQLFERVLNFDSKKGIPSKFLCDYFIEFIVDKYFFKNSDVWNALCDFYKVPEGDTTGLANQGQKVAEIYGDFFFYYPNMVILDHHQSSGNTYQFMFTFPGGFGFGAPYPSWFKGEGHAAELAFLFLIPVFPFASKEQIHMSTEMLKYWSNFAKKGDPNGDNTDVVWPKYNSIEKLYLDLGSTITSNQYAFRERMELWDGTLRGILLSIQPVINSPSGTVRGITIHIPTFGVSVSQYRGIPFAEPPIGNLRFSKPRIVRPWVNVLDASKYRPVCPQFLLDSKTIMSENCLFLNIYVPKTTETNMSVMIFIHGGGYVLGTGSLYDGSSLALVGNVIVVTINYRLGFLGFMSTMDSSSPGNYGLWDQRMAIRWVKENIASFGGNPSSITIFGESAGAFSVSLQALYPDNKGLFQNVIAQSGTATSPAAWASFAGIVSQRLGNILKCNTTNTYSLVSCFKLKSVTDIIRASYNFIIQNPLMGFLAVVDGEFLAEDPKSLLENTESEASKFFRSLNLIVGTVDAEGSIFIELLPSYLGNDYNFDIQQGVPTTTVCDVMIPSLVEQLLSNNSLISDRLCEFYRESDGDATSTGEQARRITDLFGDIYFYYPSLQALDAHQSSGNTYQFMFTMPGPYGFGGPYPAWFEGQGHGSELAYLFLVPILPFRPSDEVRLSTEMLKYWTNFAKTGDPNGDGAGTVWPKYTSSSQKYLELNSTIVQKQSFFKDRMMFWNETVRDVLRSDFKVIVTPSGAIRGIQVGISALNSSVYQFSGIPYAEPPIDNLRFRKPVIIKPWNHTLDASNFGPVCPQFSFSRNTIMSENCLFLNIYVPKTKDSNMSVMIYIHGGGYISGGGSSHDGSSMAIVGNVIVVTINYRLGFLGFMSTMDSSSPGNYGLWDQRMAIRWVKENIASFGGNPSSITIFGLSAGGISVSLQALYPGNKGLFQNVIAQSGLASSPQFATTSLASSYALQVGDSMGCNTVISSQLVSCLRQKSMYEILNASNGKSLGSVPVIDGDFITDIPLKLLENSESEAYKFFMSLRLVVGNVDAEGSLLLSTISFLPGNNYKFDIQQGIPTSFLCGYMTPYLTEKYLQNIKSISEKLCDFYKVQNGDTTAIAEQARNVIDIFGDIIFYHPSKLLLDIHQSSGNTYQYMLTMPGNYGIGEPYPSWLKGQGHGSDSEYLFDMVTNPYATVDELKLSLEMLKYWTNFAKTGNPNGNNTSTTWKRYTLPSRSYIELNSTIKQEAFIFKERMELWDGVMASLRREEDNSYIGSGSTTKASYIILMCMVYFTTFLYTLQSKLSFV